MRRDGPVGAEAVSPGIGPLRKPFKGFLRRFQTRMRSVVR